MPFVSCTTPMSSCRPRRVGRSRGPGWSGAGHALLRATPHTWDTDALELISDFIDVGDRVAVRLIWRGLGHGPESTIELTSIQTVRKGKILNVDYFWDHTEALEAVGLSEQDAHAES